MTQLTDTKKQAVKSIASEVIKTIGDIADEAKKNLENTRQPQGHGNVFAIDQGTLVGGNTAPANLERINFSEKENLKALVTEPAIARIVARTEDGSEQVYYISRSTPLTTAPEGATAKFASYRAPIGRLAAIPVGKDVSLTIGRKAKSFEVLVRTKIHPKFDRQWDSLDNTVEDFDGVVTIPSFRNLFWEENKPTESRDLLSSLLAEEEDGTEGAIIEGLRREVIERMQLRDQPILDQYQDEIFRLPLDNQLIIHGPPGTGKTTTLIRRLGQKLDQAFFTEEEKELIKHAQSGNALHHKDSWVMFTPTELLKLYLKEAFNREGIPAPEERIRTWSYTRRHLARNVLGILKSSTGGTLTLVSEESIFTASATDDTIGWFEDFRSFYLADLQAHLLQAVEWLSDNSTDSRVTVFVSKIKKILNTHGAGKKITSAIGIVGQIASLEQEINAIVQSYGDQLSESRARWVNAILQTNKGFLDELAGFLDSIQKELSNEVAEEEDEGDDSEDEVIPARSTANQRRNQAFREYALALNRLARTKHTGRLLSTTSKTARIIAWLGESLPTDSELRAAGVKLGVRTRLRTLVNPVKLYLEMIPSRYLQFRRSRLKEGAWYRDTPAMDTMVKNRHVNGLELDLLVLLMLRHAGELLGRLSQDDIDKKSRYAILPMIRAEYRNQVLVDEASDFSPIQLACMMELSHPRIRSFFACGDILQRVTRYGLRNKSQMEWISKGIEFRPMAIAYRQSRRLTDLARSIADLGGGDFESALAPSGYEDNEGELPILQEQIAEKELAEWLGLRIREVERRVGKLPSIAIFVDGEPAVEPLAKDLKEILESTNIQVVSCPQGKVIGQDGAVRVFDVQHIKGLEFEAVFFVGADKLAEHEPDIFSKFLYVGATRAATYFGITCHEQLPAVMESLRGKFGTCWTGEQ